MPTDNWSNAVAVDQFGNSIIAGAYYNSEQSLDAVLTIIASDGDGLWRYVQQTDGRDSFNSVSIDGVSGRVFVGGYKNAPDRGSAILLMLDPR